MAKPVLSDPRFFSEEAAFEYVEAQLWPNGPVCPHCGEIEQIGQLEGVRSKPSKKNPEGVVQVGLRKCYACRGQPLRCARARFLRIATFPCGCGCKLSTCFVRRRKASLRASFNGCLAAA